MTDEGKDLPPGQWQRVKEVFGDALERPPAERAAYVDAVCGKGEAEVRREVEALLAAHQESDSFLQTPAAAVTPLIPNQSGLVEGEMLGAYRVLRTLGRGGMATVYLARDLRHRRSVALKVLHPDLGQALGAERFLREIDVAANLTHPHILPLHDSGEAASLLYYVMPYIEGESLRDRLHREIQLPVADAFQLAREVADALAYAHGQGVIHRDIKPENILLSGGHALVADFGIARALSQAGSARLTETGMAVGTAAYMSPEQASAASNIDGRSDVYSLGCVLYEMLAGEPPYTGPTPQAIIAKRFSDPVPRIRRVRPSVPERMEKAITRALAPVPADRFATASEFALALQSIDVTPDGRARRPTTLAAPALGIGFLIGLGVLFAWRHSHRSKDEPRNDEVSPGSVWDRQEGPVPRIRVLHWNSCDNLATLAPQCSRSPVEMPNVRGAPDWLVSLGDTLLIVSQPNLGYLMSYNGERWRIAARYDHRRFSGGLRLATSPGDTSLSFAVDTGSGGRTELYDWGPRGFRRAQLIGVGARSSAVWTDGRLVIGTDSGWFLHQNDRRWIRRNGGSTPVRHIWGSSGKALYAIGSLGSRYVSDSLLTFDGNRWKQVDIRPDSTLLASYRAGKMLDDGSQLVAGSACDSIHCRPLLLRLLPRDSIWLEIPLPHMGALRLYEIWGDDHDDFYLGAASARAPDDPEGVGCRLNMTCVVHMVRGRIRPEPEIGGRGPIGLARMHNRIHALFDDGTLWRYTGRRFEYESELPGLELRDVSANAFWGVNAVGGDGTIFGLPPAGDSYDPVHTASPSPTFHRVIVLDTGVALLDDSGEVFTSRCLTSPISDCPRTLRRLESLGGRRINDIAVSEDGTLIGVGNRGLVASWMSSRPSAALLPHDADQERLTRIVARPGLPAVALGEHVILEQAQLGRWRVLRKLLDQEVGRATDLTVTKDGALVVSADPLPGHWRLTLYGPATSTQTILEDIGVPPRILALPDGRIVLAHSYPADRTFGGWLTVLSSTHDSVGVRVDLPIKMDAYGLADDGKNLYVAGSGLQIARIPLDSLN